VAKVTRYANDWQRDRMDNEYIKVPNKVTGEPVSGKTFFVFGFLLGVGITLLLLWGEF